MHTPANGPDVIGFFDPRKVSDPAGIFAFGGPGHLLLVLVLAALLALLIASRKRLPALRANRSFMVGTATLILCSELAAVALRNIFQFEPAYERIPLHLCPSLKLALPLLIVLDRLDLAKYISIWAIGAGLISLVNLTLGGVGPGSFFFWHYLWGHYYLFLMPIFLFLSGDFRYSLDFHVRSLLGLFGWSLLIFFVNWALDTNWLYSGPHNKTAVPFIPNQFMVWPLNYASYVVVAVVILSVVYQILTFFQPRVQDLREATSDARRAPGSTRNPLRRSGRAELRVGSVLADAAPHARANRRPIHDQEPVHDRA